MELEIYAAQPGEMILLVQLHLNMLIWYHRTKDDDPLDNGTTTAMHNRFAIDRYQMSLFLLHMWSSLQQCSPKGIPSCTKQTGNETNL